MWVSLTPISENRKTGPIPVSVTEEKSCPKECPLKGTDCYARLGPLGMHWRKVKEGSRGTNWDEFCERVRKFPKGQLFRHNSGGDLPKEESSVGIDRLDKKKCLQLSKSCKNIKGWTYTHYSMKDKHNRDVVKKMNSLSGMVVNLSADSLSQADELYNLGIAPVTVTVPDDVPNIGNKTPGGITVVICPAQTQENMTCQMCKLCTIKDRKSIVGFKAHGITHKRLSNRLKVES